ncbi:MAG: hypothetical protein LBI10_10980 [Deltaproteobacteria bacterium]|jgi:rod shape-determining protein MreD|nr:hypothetical protein [Deltaproteobacteria bacterium]
MAFPRYSPAAPLPFSRLWPFFLLGPVLTALTGRAEVGVALAGFRPEWPFLLTLYLSLRTEGYLAYIGAFYFGLFQGYLSPTPPGLYSLKLLVGVLIVRGVIRKLELGGAGSLFLLTLGVYGGLAGGLEPWLLGLVKPAPKAAPYLTAETLLLTARICLITALACPLVFGILDRLFKPKEAP